MTLTYEFWFLSLHWFVVALYIILSVGVEFIRATFQSCLVRAILNLL